LSGEQALEKYIDRLRTASDPEQVRSVAVDWQLRNELKLPAKAAIHHFFGAHPRDVARRLEEPQRESPRLGICAVSMLEQARHVLAADGGWQ